MNKDYQELITQALTEKNWELIIQLATEAKNTSLGEVFLGIRKGYVNLFTGGFSKLEDMFEEAGIKCFSIYTQPSLNKLIKNGELTLDMVLNEPVVIFSGKATVNAKLMALNWPVNNFTARSSSRNTKKKDKNGFNIYDHFCTLTNKTTNETITFKLDDQKIALTALIREARIDSILNDL
jgi:hypothetical protein